jgi:hypothetical protein
MTETALQVTERLSVLLKLGPEQRRELSGQLESWADELVDEARDDGYDEGFWQGQEDRPYPAVDDTTLDNIKLGVSLIAKGDMSARVYLDRAFQDFRDRYI